MIVETEMTVEEVMKEIEERKRKCVDLGAMWAMGPKILEKITPFLLLLEESARVEVMAKKLAMLRALEGNKEVKKEVDGAIVRIVRRIK